MAELTDTEREMLAFERKWYLYSGVKEADVRAKFGVSITRYYQLLNALINRPEALSFDSLTVRRLQRIRDARRVG